MKIEDDFVNQHEFNKIQKLIMEHTLPWLYNDKIDYEDDVNKFQFTHVFYDNQKPVSPFSSGLAPILNIINPVSILLY